MTQSTYQASSALSAIGLILPESEMGMSPGRQIDNSGAIVILGANGTGKSRLGVWLEFNGPQASSVHRISAQRSLTLPSSTNVGALSLAQEILLYGTTGDHVRNNTAIYKRGNRWNNEPAVGQLNDYVALLGVLFAENYEQLLRVQDVALTSGTPMVAPRTKLNIAKMLWENILPHRRLILKSGEIEVASKDQNTQSYNAAQMSDGERVIFYLIGQCLAAPQNSILVIDEPEVHVHKALQAPLWDELQRVRSDCLFVYMTHDLDFAVTRTGAPRVWLKNYHPNNGWQWSLIPPSDELPEALLLTLIGSRKAILFVEGTRGSLDDILFSILYPKYTIVPRGSCDAVISATRAFRSLNQFHDIDSHGIIDRDFRTSDDIEALNALDIHVLGVSEVENLFLL